MFKKYLPYYCHDNCNQEEFNIYIDPREALPTEQGGIMKHQQLIANMMKGITNIESLLIVHEVGTGKSCTAIQAIESNIKDGMYGMKRAIVLNKGKAIANNLINELVNKCTVNYKAVNERISKSLWSKYYSFETFELFAKKVRDMSDANIFRQYNRSFIVIDEVHNLLNEDGFIYQEIIRFITLLQSKKVLLLSGTPVKDSPEDFVPILNLVLPSNLRIQKNLFRTKYYDSRGNLTNEFKSLLYNRVSYLKASHPEAPVVDMGALVLGLKRFKVVSHTMSAFQSQVYAKAYAADAHSGGVYNNSRQAIRFVFPDGSYGSTGFDSYLHPKTYRLSDEFKRDLQKYGTDFNSVLRRVEELSAKYAYCIKKTVEADARNEKTFIYDDMVKGSGLILLYQLFLFVGFKKVRLISAETTTVSEISKIQKVFNSDPLGNTVSTLLGSKVVAEGFTLLDVTHEHIVPHWNNTETVQVLARGIRMGSHNQLLKIKPDAKVYVYRHATFPRSNQATSIDYIMTKVSEEKDTEVQKILSAIREVSITCNQFRSRNGGRCDHKDPSRYNHNNIDTGFVSKYNRDRADHINAIIKAFKTNSVLTIKQLEEIVNIRSPEILNYLQDIVGAKVSFENESGITCYLCYDGRNTYFTIESLRFETNPTASYYSTELKPYTLESRQGAYNNALNVFGDQNSNRNTQRLIELAVTIKMCNLEPKGLYYQTILEKYKDYYEIVGNERASVWYISEFVEEKARPRCLIEPKTTSPWTEWTECEAEYIEDLNLKRTDAVDRFEANVLERGLKYYGIWNPDLSEFCIKLIGSKNKDKRKVTSGKRCVNWNKSELIQLARDCHIDDNRDWEKWADENNRDAMCAYIRNWFETNNLVLENRSCGVQNKKK